LTLLCKLDNIEVKEHYMIRHPNSMDVFVFKLYFVIILLWLSRIAVT